MENEVTKIYVEREEFDELFRYVRQTRDDVQFIKGKMERDNDWWMTIGVIGAIVIGIINLVT